MARPTTSTDKKTTEQNRFLTEVEILSATYGIAPATLASKIEELSGLELAKLLGVDAAFLDPSLSKENKDKAAKTAYKQLSLIFHPDRHSKASGIEKEAVEEAFKLVNNAFAKLSEIIQNPPQQQRPTNPVSSSKAQSSSFQSSHAKPRSASPQSNSSERTRTSSPQSNSGRPRNTSPQSSHSESSKNTPPRSGNSEKSRSAGPSTSRNQKEEAKKPQASKATPQQKKPQAAKTNNYRSKRNEVEEYLGKFLKEFCKILHGSNRNNNEASFATRYGAKAPEFSKDKHHGYGIKFDSKWSVNDIYRGFNNLLGRRTGPAIPLQIFFIETSSNNEQCFVRAFGDGGIMNFLREDQQTLRRVFRNPDVLKKGKEYEANIAAAEERSSSRSHSGSRSR